MSQSATRILSWRYKDCLPEVSTYDTKKPYNSSIHAELWGFFMQCLSVFLSRWLHFCHQPDASCSSLISNSLSQLSDRSGYRHTAKMKKEGFRTTPPEWRNVLKPFCYAVISTFNDDSFDIRTTVSTWHEEDEANSFIAFQMNQFKLKTCLPPIHSPLLIRNLSAHFFRSKHEDMPLLIQMHVLQRQISKTFSVKAETMCAADTPSLPYIGCRITMIWSYTGSCDPNASVRYLRIKLAELFVLSTVPASVL